MIQPRSLRVVELAAVAITMCCLSVAQAEKPTRPPGGNGGPAPVELNPAIAFMTVNTGRQDIIVAAADLASEIVLTKSIQYKVGKGNNSHWAYLFGSPTWSPDGTKVAFWASYRPVSPLLGNYQLWVVPAGGGQGEIVSNYANDDPFQQQNGVTGTLNWSPTGKELIYTTYTNSLVAVEVATGDVNVLLYAGDHYEYPVFESSLSPDSDLAAGYQGRIAISNFGDIYTAPIASDANGFLQPIDPATIQNITNTEDQIEGYSSWSPDGSTIACYLDDGNTESLAVIDVASGVLVPFHPDYATVGAGHDRAAWTSDGLNLIYRTKNSGIDINDLTIIATDGSTGPMNYTGTGGRREAGPAWNPNWDPNGPGKY